MTRFVEGVDRKQSTLFPECLEDWICADNPVRSALKIGGLLTAIIALAASTEISDRRLARNHEIKALTVAASGSLVVRVFFDSSLRVQEQSRDSFVRVLTGVLWLIPALHAIVARCPRRFATPKPVRSDAWQ